MLWLHTTRGEIATSCACQTSCKAGNGIDEKHSGFALLQQAEILITKGRKSAKATTKASANKQQ